MVNYRLPSLSVPTSISCEPTPRRVMLGLPTIANKHPLLCISTHPQAFIHIWPLLSKSLFPKCRMCTTGKSDDVRWLRHNIK